MRKLVLAGLIVGATLAWEPAFAQKNVAGWTFTGEMTTPRYDHTATLLRNGKVLVAGGAGPKNCDGPVTRTAELFDPATGTWSETGSLNRVRSNHTATLLQNGEVLVAGGVADTSAELYDPKTGMWRSTGSMNTIGKNISATLTPTGKVLAVGASYDGVIGAELYDPETGAWSTTAAPNFGGSLAFLVYAGGKVLAVAQGSPWDYAELSAQLFDMETERWRPAGDLKMFNVQSVTLLRDDNVLVTGLYGANYATRAELFNPFSETWSIPGDLSTFRHYGGYSATLLGNGQVLVAGGVDYRSQKPVTAEELYNPGSGMWTFTSRLLKSRDRHTATLLPDGQVLIAGGVEGISCSDSALGTVELYDPRITSTDPDDHVGTWIHRNLNRVMNDVSEVAMDAANPKLMYAAAEPGLFKTTDGGKTWAQTSDLAHARAVAMDPHNSSTVFASNSQTARKTTDGGETWTEVRPNPARLSGAMALAIDPSNPSTVYAVLVTDGTRDDRYDGLSKSVDGGSTFSYINSGLPFTYFYYGFESTAIAIDPSAPSTLFAFSIGLAKSTNGGTSWLPVNVQFPIYVAALAVDPSQSSYVYAATQQGLLRSGDGGTSWEQLLNGLPTALLTDVIVDPSKSTTVYVSTYNSGVFKSIDRGQHFTTFSEGLPSSLPISSLAIDATGTFLVAATEMGVFTFSSGNGPLPPIIRRRCGNMCAH